MNGRRVPRDRRDDRRGSVGESLQWVFRIGFAATLLLLLLAQIAMITSIQQEPKHLEMSLFQERIINGPAGVWMREPGTGRALPGMLDMRRVTEASLQQAYGQDPELYGAKLTVYYSEADLAADRSDIHAYLPNEAFVNQYLSLGQAGLTGAGGALYERHVLPVVIGVPAGSAIAGQNAWLMIETVKRT